MSNDASSTTMQPVIVTRLFDAPIELVWQAWTDPEIVKRWWGPNGFTAPVTKIDFREGGTSLVCIRAPQFLGGQDMYSTWTYQKIVPLERIEYIHNLADQEGRKLNPTVLGLPPDFPQDSRHIVTFKSVGKQTEMNMTEHGFVTEHMFNLAKTGLEQCLDKMAAIFSKV